MMLVVGTVEITLSPGAIRSSCGPPFEKYEREEVEPMLPTAMTFGNDAGWDT